MIRGTHTKIIVVIPCRGWAGADIGVGAFVFGPGHSLTETGGFIAPVSRSTAIANGKKILVLVGQIVDIIDGKQRIQPTDFAAVGRVVSEAYTRAQIVITAVKDPMAKLVDVGKAMLGIVVIGRGIPNGRAAHDEVPTRIVITGDKKCFVQISRVGHGVLLVFHAFVEHGRHLVNGLGGQTAVEHIGKLVVVDAGVVKVGNETCLGSNARIHHLGLVAHNHQESGCILSVLGSDETLDFLSGSTNHIGIVHIHVDAFQGLPGHPILDAVLEHAVGDDQHLHGGGPEVGVVIIDIPEELTVEQQVVNPLEIRAVGLHHQVFRGSGIGTFETDFHLDVVEDTNDVVDRVVADGLDGKLSHLNATHNALYSDASHGLRAESSGLIGGFIVGERNVFGVLVFKNFRLARRQGVNAIFLKPVIRSGITRHPDAGRCTQRNGNQLVHHGDLGIALIAADNGIGHGERGEDAAFALQFAGFEARERKRSLETGHVAFYTCRLVGGAQTDALLCHSAQTEHYGKKNKHVFFHVPKN